jgi:hypothetical protein
LQRSRPGGGVVEELAELQGECDGIDMEGLADVLGVFEEGEAWGEDEEDTAEKLIPPPTTKRTKVFSIGKLS